MTDKIAVIGAGIAGLSAAYRLSSRFDVDIFEANHYLGGHTASIDVSLPTWEGVVDTGFMVFNERTYPRFCSLLDMLGIKSAPSNMSFSVQSQPLGLTYCGGHVPGMLLPQGNWRNPRFYRFMLDIVRFNRIAKRWLLSPDVEMTLNQFLKEKRFSSWFINGYILPMASAIWSTAKRDVNEFPAYFILHFFNNHGLLSIRNRPKWLYLPGGAKTYVAALRQHVSGNVHLASPVEAIERSDSHVNIRVGGENLRYDKVVIATHSDQALKLLVKPSDDEMAILTAIPYTSSDVVLHHDEALLPLTRHAWASWNYHDDGMIIPTVTYYLNLLQKLDSPHPICVSLNQTSRIHPDKVIQQFTYHHPSFTENACQAQKRFADISGKNRTYYCGAYWGHGFHEDGCVSGIRVASQLGVDDA